MRLRFKVFVASFILGTFMLATVGTALAGPPDFGLGIALTTAGNNAEEKGVNPSLETTDPAGVPGQGTHTAAGRVACLNPVQGIQSTEDCPD